MTDTLDIAAALDTAEAIARRAGAVLAEHFQRPRAAQSKGSSLVDLVTEADGACEALIVAALRAAFPAHYICGEEGGGYGPAPAGTLYHWYVDPLDGTTNFAHRFPIFSVSLALSGPDLQPILGVVHAPLLGETYKGVRGGGATLNGQRLRVSSVPDLAQALVITGFPYSSWTAEDNNSARFGHFLRRVQAARCGGSAALDLCWVAAGRCDVYWEEGARPWDVQAGILFVREAGGTVSDYAGQVSQEALSGQRILATNGLVHQQALAVIQHGDGAPRPVPSA